MKRYLTVCFLLLLLAAASGCVQPGIVAGKTKSDQNKTKNADATTDAALIEKYDNNKLVLMFFERYEVFPPKRVETVITNPVQEKPVEVVKKHYNIRYIADWVKDGKRYVKFKDMKTNTEYVIQENSKTGYIQVIERSLFHYKLKIEDEIIEVKR